SLFLYKLDSGASVEVARTMAVNTRVLCEVVYVINSRRLTRSVLDREGLLGDPYALLTMAAALLFQFVYIHWSPMHGIFGSAALSASAWLLTLTAALVLFFAVEIEKAVEQWLHLHRARVRP